MNKALKILSVFAVSVGMLLTPAISQAQDLSLRVEPGVALPLTRPQSQRFKVGGDMAVKPELGIGSYFSLGPSVSLLAVPSSLNGIDTGTAWTLGGFVRVKRPHDETNTDTGFRAVSPWADADAQYVRTGPLDRFGWAVAVGASWPTSDERNLWIGPFARYQGVYQPDRPGTNLDTHDAKVLILGLSFEFGGGYSKKEEPVADPLPPPVKQLPPPIVVVPVAVAVDVRVESKQTIQFAYDSAVLDDVAQSMLVKVANKLLAAKTFTALKVEGHASSEGPVKYNNDLSLRRAQSVMDFLVVQGVAREKITVVGFGSNVPVSDNKTEATRAPNRRAEFVVSFTTSN